MFANNTRLPLARCSILLLFERKLASRAKKSRSYSEIRDCETRQGIDEMEDEFRTDMTHDDLCTSCIDSEATLEKILRNFPISRRTFYQKNAHNVVI